MEKMRLLEAFCSPDGRREITERPWTVGRYSYATTGVMVLRVAAVPGVEPMSKTDGIAAMIDGWLVIAESDVRFPMPSLQFPKPKETECTACDGRGYEHDCKDCGCECKACSGLGYRVQPIVVKFGSAMVNVGVWKRVAALPGVRLSNQQNANGHLSFTFDGGAGLMNPRRMDFDIDDVIIVEAESQAEVV